MADLELTDRQTEQWALLRNLSAGPRSSLAIFVHGWRGNYLTTWGTVPGLLQREAAGDATLAAWDYLFVGYATRDMATYLDIAKLLATQWGNAASGRPPFNSRYSRLALFGHSLGTLGIRQLLCAGTLQPPGMLNALHSVTLFGTPLNGSPLASVGRVIGGPITDALKPGNVQLRMLRSWNESIHKHYGWRSVRVVLGTDDKVVGNEYSDLVRFQGDDAQHQLYNLDHSDLVKPSKWAPGSAIHDEIVGALR